MYQPPKHIRKLIKRFFAKQATDRELNELQAWLEEHTDHVRYFQKINEEYQAENLRKFGPRQTHEAWQRLSARLFPEKERNIKHHKGLPYRVLRIAASVSIILVTAFYAWKMFFPQPSDVAENMLVFRSGEKNAQFLLPDSSWVWLNAHSTIEYAAAFLENREVRLTGEAFFDVRKRQKKNLIVLTENLSIQVKGTRFNVRAYAAKDENATLEEGEIELTIKGDRKTYSMAPGDQITIHKSEQKIIRKKVNPTNFSAWKEEKIVFDNASLADIIAKVENRYSVKITIDSALAHEERLSMTIENEPIEDILEMIELSSMLQYKIEKDHITIFQ